MTEERERERDADSQTKEEKACMWEENDFVGMLYMRADRGGPIRFQVISID